MTSRAAKWTPFLLFQLIFFSFLVGALGIPAFAFDHSYKQWDQSLKKFVVTHGAATRFKYYELQKDRKDLDAFLIEVKAVKASDYQSWSEPQKLAFLFNSYNALTVDLVASHTSPQKPLSSIKDIGSFIKSTWKIKFFNFLGEESSLDHIEQELARPQFDEPRMHFAFNCAAIGCPNLNPEAFIPEKLEAQLENSAHSFLDDKNRNTFAKNESDLQISSIFKWYGEDFDHSKKFKSLRHFLATHMKLSKPVETKLEDGSLPIKFLDYDWKLNIDQPL